MTHWNRRAFISGCGCATAAALAKVAPTIAASPQPSDYYDGCTLTAAGAREFGGVGALLRTSGIPQIDYVVTQEVNGFMLPLFQLSPYCAFFDDSDSPNAFATTRQLAGAGQGTVAFGITLMREILTGFRHEWGSMGVHAAGAVFAHEFGHIAQFVSGWTSGGPKMELHADFMAGWYTAIRNLQGGGNAVNFREIAQQMFNIGDFAFTSPNHHGTPQQRVQAYLAGVQLTTQRGGMPVAVAYQLGRQVVGA